MKSILDGRPLLKEEVDRIAEVAGYLWQKGWAERNGGNITVNITEFVDDAIRALPAISEVKEIGVTLPALKGQYFFCKGTNKRMRDLAQQLCHHSRQSRAANFRVAKPFDGACPPDREQYGL